MDAFRDKLKSLLPCLIPRQFGSQMRIRWRRRQRLFSLWLGVGLLAGMIFSGVLLHEERSSRNGIPPGKTAGHANVQLTLVARASPHEPSPAKQTAARKEQRQEKNIASETKTECSPAKPSAPQKVEAEKLAPLPESPAELDPMNITSNQLMQELHPRLTVQNVGFAKDAIFYLFIFAIAIIPGIALLLWVWFYVPPQEHGPTKVIRKEGFKPTAREHLSRPEKASAQRYEIDEFGD